MVYVWFITNIYKVAEVLLGVLYLMGFIKKYIIISVVIILSILPPFLSNIIVLIPSTEIKYATIIVLYVLFLIFMIFEIYGDIRKKQYITTAYIVLTDIIIIASYAILGYLNFVSFNRMNVQALVKRNSIRIVNELIFFASVLIHNFLKSQRFKKKIKETEK